MSLRSILPVTLLVALASAACGSGSGENSEDIQATGGSGAAGGGGAGGDGGGGASPSRALVLIGGGTHVCTSASPESCGGSPAFPQKTSLPLKTALGDLYEMTPPALSGLQKRPELSASIKAKLANLPKGVKWTLDELLDELDAEVGLGALPNGSVERAVILGYTAVRQEEVVDLAASSESTRAIFEEIVASAGGKGAAVVGVISASSGDGFDSYAFHQQVFAQAGAKEAPWIPVNLAYRLAVDGAACSNLEGLVESEYGLFDSRRRYPEQLAQMENACADPKSVAAAVNDLGAVFFTGGDQAKHKRTMIAGGEDTAEMAALRARYTSGKLLVAGTSAGTAVQAARGGPPMITGGESYNALAWGAYETPCDAPPGDVCLDDLTFDAAGGLGLFTFGLIDTHFSERGRQGRILRLAADTEEKRAFGVDENTALVVRDAGGASATMEVIGEHGVFVFDLREAEAEVSGDFSIDSVRASYLLSGDRYDPSTWAVTFAQDKVDIAGDETYADPLSPSQDILSSPSNVAGTGGRKYPREWALVAQDLCDAEADSTYGLTHEGPDLSSDYPLTYEVAMTKGQKTRCFDGPDQGDIAFADMWVDIYPY